MSNWKDTKCGKCKIQRRSPICNSCEKFNRFVPMTNADRIRNMSDEELAEFLQETVYESGDNLFLCYDCSIVKGECKDCYLRWLQAESEE